MTNLDEIPWQKGWWETLRRTGEKLPHAILLHGQSGIGKVAFARFVGRALLCEAPGPDGRPCGHCQSCTWILGGNHPDYRLVRPEALALAEGAEEAEAEPGDTAEEVPAEGEGAKGRRAPSKEIRIQQVRELAELLTIGSHRGGRRVVMIYPAHAMNVFTANALLKMLEEPPENTVFLLVTDALDRLLPTVLSRCRKIALAPPEPSVALSWLKGQGIERAPELLAEQGGAPVAALLASADTTSRAALRDALFAVLAHPQGLASLAVAEVLAKCEPPLVVGWIQRWLYDICLYRLAGRIRYYPSHQTAIAALSENLDLRRCMTYSRTLTAERRVADHPLNARLFVENLLLGYCRALQSR